MNPDVVQVVTAAILAWMQAHPPSPPDGSHIISRSPVQWGQYLAHAEQQVCREPLVAMLLSPAERQAAIRQAAAVVQQEYKKRFAA